MIGLQFSLLLIAFFVIVLLVARLFHKHQRAIFWGVAIFLCIGVLVLVGTGVLKLFRDGHANLDTLLVIIGCFSAATVLVIGATEPERFLGKKHKTATEQSPSESEKREEVVLPRKLDTPLAKKVFTKALEEGLMEVKGSHYDWKRSKILLAYMCGRIYCNDCPVPDRGKEGKFIWNPGDDSSFPDFDLNALFQTKDIGQSRNNRKFCPLPNDFDIIDRFFE